MKMTKLIPRIAIPLAMIGSLCSTGWAAQTVSKYTSLDTAECKMLSHATANDPLPDVFDSLCPGRDGIRVGLEGGDARSWIVLIPRGVKYENGKQLNNNWGAFPAITGKRLEWRYHGSKLVALIVRNEWTEQDGQNVVSGLVIWRVDTTKLNETCAIGRTTSNEEAQTIADDLGKPCLEKE
jgi:hypothetical protein